MTDLAKSIVVAEEFMKSNFNTYLLFSAKCENKTTEVIFDIGFLTNRFCTVTLDEESKIIKFSSDKIE